MTVSHDHFPDYEGFIDDEWVYYFPSEDSGPSIVNLNWMTSSTVARQVYAETPQCCP
jgi:hypothetical protein